MSVATVELPQRGSRTCVDGNEAAASVAYALSEVIATYSITPASAMGEHADTWSAGGRTNLWGAVPEVVEMQSKRAPREHCTAPSRPGRWPPRSPPLRGCC